MKIYFKKKETTPQESFPKAYKNNTNKEKTKTDIQGIRISKEHFNLITKVFVGLSVVLLLCFGGKVLFTNVLNSLGDLILNNDYSITEENEVQRIKRDGTIVSTDEVDYLTILECDGETYEFNHKELYEHCHGNEGDLVSITFEVNGNYKEILEVTRIDY